MVNMFSSLGSTTEIFHWLQKHMSYFIQERWISTDNLTLNSRWDLSSEADEIVKTVLSSIHPSNPDDGAGFEAIITGFKRHGCESSARCLKLRRWGDGLNRQSDAAFMAPGEGEGVVVRCVVHAVSLNGKSGLGCNIGDSSYFR